MPSRLSQGVDAAAKKRTMARAAEVFVSFANVDAKHVDDLEAQLASAEASGKVRVWHRGKLDAGAPESVVDARLASADAIVLLVSAAYQKQRLGEARVACRRVQLLQRLSVGGATPATLASRSYHE